MTSIVHNSAKKAPTMSQLLIAIKLMETVARDCWKFRIRYSIQCTSPGIILHQRQLFCWEISVPCSISDVCRIEPVEIEHISFADWKMMHFETIAKFRLLLWIIQKENPFKSSFSSWIIECRTEFNFRIQSQSRHLYFINRKHVRKRFRIPSKS